MAPSLWGARHEQGCGVGVEAGVGAGVGVANFGPELESESLKIRRLYILGHGYNSEPNQEQVRDQCPLVSVKLIRSRDIRFGLLSNPVRSESNVNQNVVQRNVGIAWVSITCPSFCHNSLYSSIVSCISYVL